LKPPVAKVVVCDPRKNALLQAGNKNDRIDARKLADLLRCGLLSPVYHGESGVRTLRELARSYLTLTRDLTRVMNRIKGLYRSWAIRCNGQTVYSPLRRPAWLEKLPEAGVRRRAEWLYQQLDDLQPLPRQARQEMVIESRKHRASSLLDEVPWLGPVRVALLMALIQTPQRFRTKRQLWEYSGLGLETRASGEYCVKGTCNGKLVVLNADTGALVTVLPIGLGTDGAAYEAGLHHTYTANAIGTMTVIQQDSADRYRVLENAPTRFGAHSLVVDPATHRI
jgi:transposase